MFVIIISLHLPSKALNAIPRVFRLSVEISKAMAKVDVHDNVEGIVFGNAVTYSVLAWCICRKGPVFVAMFKPLGISIAAFLGVIFLGDTLHVGSIIGAIVIVVGFYGVIWAQSKEEEEGKVHTDDSQRLSSQRTPLLESHINM
ncbi:hypothetical protein Q3G72_012073 [Acer saccharum]|nr:hypothetical protein Q3G72_012073 [Acer saccharum]